MRQCLGLQSMAGLVAWQLQAQHHSSANANPPLSRDGLHKCRPQFAGATFVAKTQAPILSASPHEYLCIAQHRRMEHQ